MTDEDKTVSIIAEWAFMLSEDPSALDTIGSQELLHIVLPHTAERNKFMPKDATKADFWMNKHGDPLTSTDAAIDLVIEVHPECAINLSTNIDSTLFASAEIFACKGNSEPVYAQGPSLATALVIALLNSMAPATEERELEPAKFVNAPVKAVKATAKKAPAKKAAVKKKKRK